MPATGSTILHAHDLALVRRLRRGDERAFREFFEEYYDRLYRFTLTRTRRDTHKAEDIVQESLTKALQNLKSYRGEAQLQTWLFTICRNTIIDFSRKRGLDDNTIVLTEDRPGVRAAVESFEAPSSDDPVANAQRGERVRLVHVALDHLPKRYGDALEWKYIQGWSVLEIADKLEIGREATQSLLARAKRAFAAVYDDLAASEVGDYRNSEANP